MADRVADGVEVEWQFDAPELDAVVHWLRTYAAGDGLTITSDLEHTQLDRYFDSQDWRLYRSGYTLRVRRTAGVAEATLKAVGSSSGGLRRRREITQSLPPDENDPPVEAGPVGERIRLLAGTRTLSQLFKLETRRRTFPVERGGEHLANVALDQTRVLAPAGGSLTLRVEVEQLSSDASAIVERFVRSLQYGCELSPSTASKFGAAARALGLFPGATPALGPTRARRRMKTPEFAYATLRRDFSAFLAQEPGTRLGEDGEALHQMRVATRRLRAALSLFSDVLPLEFASVRRELAWVGDALGAVRDLDVELAALEVSAAAKEQKAALEPLNGIVRELRVSARTRLLNTLDSERYDALVERMRTALTTEPTKRAAHSVRAFAEPVLRRRYRRMREDALHLRPQSEPEAYHALRIRAKRFRYSLDFFSTLYRRPSSRLAAAIQRVQDVLGEHQDAEIAIGRFSAWAQDSKEQLPPETLVAIERIVERYRIRMQKLRRRFPRLFRRVEARWRPLRRAL